MPTDQDTIVSHNTAGDAVAQAAAAQVDGSVGVASAEERDRSTAADLRGINQKLNEDNQLLFQARVRVREREGEREGGRRGRGFRGGGCW